MARRIERLFINGPAGRLEALLEEPGDHEPVEAALVCHPHPQYGGTMHNKVVHRIARGLRRAGAVVLRFNYRGVNLSEGKYDGGVGEVEDARAALSLLLSHYPRLPFTLAGFSFGSRIALKLGCQRLGARRVIAVGFPTKMRDTSFLDECTVPRIFVQSSNDEFGPIADWKPFVESLSGEKSAIVIEARDHFFDSGLEELENSIATLSDNQPPDC
jgi:alpha/beta superfamily hydrolase